MIESIAQLSTAMSQQQVSQGVALAMAGKVMDMQGQAAVELLDDISKVTSSVQTFAGDIGNILDVRG